MSADTSTSGLLIQLCCRHRAHQSCLAGANAGWISMDFMCAPEVDALFRPRGRFGVSLFFEMSKDNGGKGYVYPVEVGRED